MAISTVAVAQALRWFGQKWRRNSSTGRAAGDGKGYGVAYRALLPGMPRSGAPPFGDLLDYTRASAACT